MAGQEKLQRLLQSGKLLSDTCGYSPVHLPDVWLFPWTLRLSPQNKYVFAMSYKDQAHIILVKKLKKVKGKIPQRANSLKK
jgi:hypothetical protein